MSEFVTINGHFKSGVTFRKPEQPVAITVTDALTGESLPARIEADGKLVCVPERVVRVCSSYASVREAPND